MVGEILPDLRFDDRYSRFAVEQPGDLFGVLVARLVAIGNDDHCLAVQWREVDQVRLPCTHWCARGDETDRLGGENVLLTLDDVHRGSVG